MFQLLRKFFKRSQSTIDSNVSFIIVGIGNKGERYHNTRHNIGFCVIDAFVIKCETVAKKKLRNADIVICRTPDRKKAVCAKPSAYVNQSGRAVNELMKTYGLPLSDCLIIVDDLNIPLGELRFRRRGTDGGHKGLKSIIAETGADFPRLRIGIGPLPEGMGRVDFVLGAFEDFDLSVKKESVNKAADAVVYFMKNGIDAAMNRFNKESSLKKI